MRIRKVEDFLGLPAKTEANAQELLRSEDRRLQPTRPFLYLLWFMIFSGALKKACGGSLRFGGCNPETMNVAQLGS